MASKEIHTVVGIVSRPREDQPEYLFMSSTTDYGKYTEFLFPPGGHLNNSETDEEGLVREFQEEFGVDVRPVKKIAETKADVKDEITHWWECQMDDYRFTIDEDEVAEVDWLTKEEALNHQRVFPATKNFFRKHIT